MLSIHITSATIENSIHHNEHLLSLDIMEDLPPKKCGCSLSEIVGHGVKLSVIYCRIPFRMNCIGFNGATQILLSSTMKEDLVTCLELQLSFPTVWLSFFDEAIFTLHWVQPTSIIKVRSTRNVYWKQFFVSNFDIDITFFGYFCISSISSI